MDLQLAGKTALVTGASRGIGKAIARSFAAEGCHLVLTGRDAQALGAVAADIRTSTPVDVEVIAADIATADGLAQVTARLNGVDVLVNNAGAIPPGGIAEVDDEAWRKAWDLKVFGYINLARAACLPMTARGGGVIVNIIGSAGEKFPAAYIAGATGNAALMALTRALARGSSAQGIRVVGINPGATATERNEMLLRDRARRELGDESRWAELNTKLPFGRAAKPEEIADAAVFLASPRSGYTSGTILTIDGGAG